MGIPHYLRQLGRNIQEHRIKAGLRQIDISERIGLNYRHYQNIEAGKVNVTIGTLCRLAKLFNTSIGSLVMDC